MNPKLKRAFDYYLEHQDELVKKYNGQFIAIANNEVVGSYDNELRAIEETSKHYKMGTFLVQFVTAGDAAYTQTFYSRVAVH